ncbi:MAG: chaperonin family protein RbcX [Prochloraceae cyanobacterium]
MHSKKIARNTAKVLQSYLTYQAVRTIIDQLSETNPSQAIWLSQYSSTNNIQDSEAYLEGLMLEQKELVLRIMTVREHLAEEILEYIPEMVSTGIQQANLQHRRQLLQRLTQSQLSNSTPPVDNCDPHPDQSQSSD